MNERDFLAEVEKENNSSNSGSRLHRALSLQSNDSDSNILDRVSQARPSVNSHDRLWAQMELLNDDVEIAHSVQRRRGFLASAHAEALAELKQIQIELAQELTHEESNAGMDSYRDLWKIKDPDLLRTKLFNNRHFDLLDESVKRSAAKLDDIAEMLDSSAIAKAEGANVEEPLPKPTPEEFERGLVGETKENSPQYDEIPIISEPSEPTVPRIQETHEIP